MAIQLILVKTDGTGAGTPWTLSNLSYTGNSFGTISQDNTPRSTFIDSTGTRFYMMGDGTNAVYQYTLSTAWDISSASYDSISYNVNSNHGEQAPIGVDFKADGSQMYFAGTTLNDVFDVTINTPWNISTSGTSVSFDHGTDYPGAVRLNAAGTKMTVFDWLTFTGYQYTLSTPFDITSRSLDGSKNFNNTPHPTPYVFGFGISPDGSKMIATMRSGTDQYVSEYDLSTAFDVTSATHVQSVELSAQISAMSGLFVSPDGTNLYVSCQGTDTIYQYSL